MLKTLGWIPFRSGAVRLILFNSFDYAYARLSGLRINSTIKKDLNLDLFLTTETQANTHARLVLFPLLIGYKHSIIDIGAGIMLDRLFPNKRFCRVLRKLKQIHNFWQAAAKKKYFSFGGTKLWGDF